MKKEWIPMTALLLLIIVLIPWTMREWRKEKPKEDFQIRLKMPNGEIETLDLETYLIGVVAAEMPARFHGEALKAQAIAARTYAAKRLNQRGISAAEFHVDTTVLTQAWISEKQMREKWGWLAYWGNYRRIEEAVHGTKGKVLIYEGQYADALYHSSTGRKPTERADEVWSAYIPYLQKADSGEKEPYRFMKTNVFTPTLLAQKLGTIEKKAGFSSSDFIIGERTSAGRVKSARVLGKNFTGVQLRTLLGLPSTDFDVIIKKEEIQIKSYGNGHAVGMSQYGANDLGQKGYTHEQILKHYYPGTKLLSLGKKSEG